MNKDLEKNIKKLVKINLDAHEGYKTAADNVNDNLLNTFLSQCAKDRKSYALSLAREINIEPDEISTHFKADLHRVWMDLRTSPQKFNAKTVLKECERGEKHAVEAYDDVVKENKYPASLEKQIRLQRDEINNKFDRIREMEKEYDLKDDMRNQQTSVP
ncbi:PA2169 family four-helix-bundle protein [Fulvivirga kasyanovii]|uniref:PA2169 family four-helix-bundle protein n=1 Tax=Fulvivirga kasyanovii TaxID=396812 RepID=A0ABW9RIC4_9BACT|nr:PA2169 family four-helix-bundle protein [Fulvivirga kasyanovii]MTI23819.1 PA2169 family four-helix-bundle protein [Fulvivirga kasyanovii]